MSKTIGILGGIGPESSAVFYQRLIAAFKEKFNPKDNTYFPRIIINSIPAPELTLGASSNTLESYVEGLKFLELNSDFIAIICNTAYLYHDYFKTQIKKPILDIREKVKTAVNNKNILFLGSPNSITNNVFSLEENQCLKLSETEEQMIGEIIDQYNTKKITTDHNQQLTNLIDKYYRQVDFILIGCTELSLILNSWKDIKKIDTFDILIEETLKIYASLS
jgi:aspartate racemase